MLGKVEVKVSFEFNNIVMTKNNVFVGRRYCNQGFFVSMFLRLLMNLDLCLRLTLLTLMMAC